MKQSFIQKSFLLGSATLTASLAATCNTLPNTFPTQAENLLQIKDASSTRPNIIYILADDAGPGDFKCYNSQLEYETPNVDRLASEGIQFLQHYSGAPVCAPSRASLMTGKHTGNTHIRGNKEIQPEGQEPLLENTQTLASLLQTSGYETGATGKWGLGYPGSHGAPEEQGFDFFYGYNCQRQAHSYYPTHLWRTGVKEELEKGSYSHTLIANEALAFIEKNAAIYNADNSKPFFLFVPFTLPHAALQVTEEKLAQFADKNWPIAKKKMAAMVSLMDDDIGRIIDLVDKLGIGEDTIILFASDNGPHSEGGASPHYHNSSAGLRGQKRDLYEGGIRTPFVARWTDTIAAGQISNHISAFWDILPTFTQLAAIANPPSFDGISLLPTLTNGGEGQQVHEFLYWEFHEYGGKQGIRKGDWKGVRNNAFLNPTSTIELYNLATDPQEQENVADKYPEIAKELEALISQAHTPSELFPGFDK